MCWVFQISLLVFLFVFFCNLKFQKPLIKLSEQANRNLRLLNGLKESTLPLLSSSWLKHLLLLPLTDLNGHISTS